ncbi:MAG TPA: hypothetical protein VFT43_00335 [Candidatus Polarisedimenticolia bacterium]|nr:hypothetical protein [Candidatus Polarisedimenticolia bacterium]
MKDSTVLTESVKGFLCREATARLVTRPQSATASLGLPGGPPFSGLAG